MPRFRYRRNQQSTKHSCRARRLVAVGSLLAMTSPCWADNGAVTLIQPIQGIVIDGDLSDWPENVERLPLTMHFEEVPLDGEDFAGSIRVAYDSKIPALYVAAEIIDESNVVDSEAHWNEQDGHILYLDEKHHPDLSAPIGYAINGIKRHISGPEFSWDPAVDSASWDRVEVAVHREGSTSIHEWRVPLENPISLETSIGFDYLVNDKDATDPEGVRSFSCWGNMSDKTGRAGRCGDLVFVDQSTPVGEVIGTIRWQDQPRTNLPDYVRLTAVENPALWVQVETRYTSRYSARVPAGEYLIENGVAIVEDDERRIRIDTETSVRATVEPGKSTEVPTLTLRSVEPPNLFERDGILHELDPSQFARVDEFVRAYMDHYQIPGVSLALIQDFEVVFENTYGVRNEFTQEPVEKNTLFEAASISKPVFAFAVNRLVERGELDLDEPLYLTLPFEEIEYDERYQLITARHVLSHQTGFPNWAYMNDDGKLDLKFTPGTDYGYSGEGFEYLGRVVSQITGKTLDEVIREEVQEPLGIPNNMYFTGTPKLVEQLCVGHLSTLPSPYALPDAAGVAWSMLTEASTFSYFMLGLLNEEGLNSETYAEMLRPQVEMPESEAASPADWYRSFGLGFVLEESPYGMVIQHGGNNGDFKCKFEVYHEIGLGFAVFANNDFGDELHNALRVFLITGREES